jgi:predicted transcriptional regulator of viral defense system
VNKLDDLYGIAVGQAGYFTIGQAAEIGVSSQLLHKHLKSGNIERSLRGVYRLCRFPHGEYDDLVPVWLWSNQTGVFSGPTALRRHDLSDLLPSKVYMTLPVDQASRRLKAPDGVILDFADIPSTERGWWGPVPMVKPARAILDCIRWADPEQIVLAIDQGISRKLFSIGDVLPPLSPEWMRAFG